MESILTSIKKLLGVEAEYKHFDADITMHINSVFLILNQLGVGTENVFSITNEYQNWSEFVGDDANWESIKTYVYLRVRLLFDPPINSTVIASMERMIAEYEWRFNVAAETATTETIKSS